MLEPPSNCNSLFAFEAALRRKYAIFQSMESKIPDAFLITPFSDPLTGNNAVPLRFLVNHHFLYVLLGIFAMIQIQLARAIQFAI